MQKFSKQFSFYVDRGVPPRAERGWLSLGEACCYPQAKERCRRLHSLWNPIPLSTKATAVRLQLRREQRIDPGLAAGQAFHAGGRGGTEGTRVSVSSVSSPCLLPTATGTSGHRVEIRGNFLGTESVWDVGARAKQTSLFLKFIPSLASGQKWVINIIRISKLSCKRAHTQDAVCHNSTVQTGFKAVLVSSLS